MMKIPTAYVRWNPWAWITASYVLVYVWVLLAWVSDIGGTYMATGAWTLLKNFGHGPNTCIDDIYDTLITGYTSREQRYHPATKYVYSSSDDRDRRGLPVRLGSKDTSSIFQYGE